MSTVPDRISKGELFEILVRKILTRKVHEVVKRLKALTSA